MPSYIKKSGDSTASPAEGSLKPDTVSFSMTGKYSDVPQLKKSIQDIKTKEKEELTSYVRLMFFLIYKIGKVPF